MKDHEDTVIGIRQKGTENWGYEDQNGKLAFGPLTAKTLFFSKDAGGSDDITSYMSAARQQGQQNIEQVPVRRNLEVLEDETV
jgi:hypothetical protein